MSSCIVNIGPPTPPIGCTEDQITGRTVEVYRVVDCDADPKVADELIDTVDIVFVGGAFDSFTSSTGLSSTTDGVNISVNQPKDGDSCVRICSRVRYDCEDGQGEKESAKEWGEIVFPEPSGKKTTYDVPCTSQAGTIEAQYNASGESVTSVDVSSQSLFPYTITSWLGLDGTTELFPTPVTVYDQTGLVTAIQSALNVAYGEGIYPVTSVGECGFEVDGEHFGDPIIEENFCDYIEQSSSTSGLQSSAEILEVGANGQTWTGNSCYWEDLDHPGDSFQAITNPILSGLGLTEMYVSFGAGNYFTGGDPCSNEAFTNQGIFNTKASGFYIVVNLYNYAAGNCADPSTCANGTVVASQIRVDAIQTNCRTVAGVLAGVQTGS